MLTIGVDVGGTFTDVFLWDEENNSWLVHKVPSTPPTFVDGFLEGVLQSVGRHDSKGPGDVQRLVHGTTVATNAILTENGARVGFLLTEGCSDILYIGSGWRPRMYDIDMDPVDPLFLAPRRQSLGIRERVDAYGEVLIDLDEDQVRAAARKLVEDYAVEVFVVCYLHSYANPAHERRTRDILAELYPDIPVTLSSDVLPRRREYQRLVVSGFDGYVKPAITSYLNGVVDRLTAAGVKAPLHVMQSHGGVGGVKTIVERPVGTVLSGLAAGVIGAAHVAETAGYPDCITLDMGGTSADVALIRDGRPIITADGNFENYPLHIPMIDVRTIGAGGSSVAYVDDAGGLKVGPRSAGAYPGPACYSHGGTEPTVTDASFVLGYLNPESFRGKIDIDVEKGYRAIEEKIAIPLGISVIEAALGIHAIVNSNMAQTLRLVSINRGYDPRDFVFMPFGGAGPLQAGKLADEVGIRKILIPCAPGVLSAMGLMLAPVQHEALASFETPTRSTDLENLRSVYKDLDQICYQKMEYDGVSREETEISYYAEMRYLGQSHELEVAIKVPVGPESLSEAVHDFYQLHERTYSYADRTAEVEFVSLRSVHRKKVGQVPRLEYEMRPQGTQPAVATRMACFAAEEGYVETPVYNRNDLPSGYEIIGPAIIEQSDTTSIVYPGHKAVVDSLGNIIIEATESSKRQSPDPELKKESADPITVEVVRGLLDTITEEMQMTLVKASYSPMITEGRDATAALFDRTGRTIAQATAVPVHLGVLTELGHLFAESYPEGVAKPGDIYVTNDPYAGGTHLPDFAVAAPVFHDGKLIGYVATMTHHQDIGGFAPSSVAVEARDIHAEGQRLPMIRLIDGGKINQAVFSILEANSRTPVSLRGDLGAQIASCNTGIARYADMFARMNPVVIRDALEKLLDYGEMLTRMEIEKIPDGSYSFSDMLDDDALSFDADPIRISVTITISGSNIHFDFTGTDPQAKSAINNVPSSTAAIVYYAVRILTGDNAPNNEGCYRPISMHLPLGTIVNSSYPAPVAARGIVLKRVEDVVLGALAKALPQRMTAAHSGQYTMIVAAGLDQNGQRIQGNVGGPYAGGHGARPTKDGIDVTEHGATNGSPIPIEVAEKKLPVIFWRTALWTDSGGAGRWRGGLGYTAEIEWRGGDATLAIRRERHKFAPWGIEGGQSGPLCISEMISRNGDVRSLPGKIRLPFQTGDRIRVYTTGSGGYGSPLERRPDLVLNDVLDARVSEQAARDVYGVVISNGAVNMAETQALRERMGQRPAPVTATSGG